MPYRKSRIPSFARVDQAFREVAYPDAAHQVEDFAQRQRASFIRRIERQAFPSFLQNPLSPAYKARKIKAGADPRVMIATKTYIGAIRLFRRQLPWWKHTTKVPGRAVLYRIGFHARRHARDMHGNLTHTPLWKVATYHEFGSQERNLPARPHWRPHLAFMRQCAAPFRQQVAKNIAAKIRARIQRGA